MARCAAAGRASAIPTTLRGPNLYGTAGVRPKIREVGIFNTTATGVAVALARASAVGTKGAAITPVCLTDPTHTAVATVANTHTADATVGAPVRYASLGAAIGSGVIFTFAEFEIDSATTSGLVIICPTGTAQILDFYFEWEE
jgi:hypothetical protein